MRSIEAKKILGVKIKIDEDNYQVMSHIIPDAKEMNKRKLLQFESWDEVDKFVKWLKNWKKSYFEELNRS